MWAERYHTPLWQSGVLERSEGYEKRLAIDLPVGRGWRFGDPAKQEITTVGMGAMVYFAQQQFRAAHVADGSKPAIQDYPYRVRSTLSKQTFQGTTDGSLECQFRTHAVQQKKRLLYHLVGPHE
jgi:hypothetical protein